MQRFSIHVGLDVHKNSIHVALANTSTGEIVLNLLRRIVTHPASRVSELTPWAMAAELQPYRGHRSVA